MRTILAYGDSNTWGAVPQPERGAGGRFPPDIRWTGALRERFGARAWIVEEGLNGRTTCVDDPVEGRHKNGERLLRPLLETHAPLDLVIIMLGTNDLKARLGLPAGDIADGAGVLADIVQRSGAGPGGAAPAVLLVAPAPLGPLGWLAEMFAGGPEKSARLAAAFARVATARGLPLLDAGEVVQSSAVDGIHLDAGAHRRLGQAIAARAADLLGFDDGSREQDGEDAWPTTP